MSAEPIDKSYDPKNVENKWYTFWEENKLFAAAEDHIGKPYSIVIPPPNVTGVLHMGHALNNTLQDILCRYKRLCGGNVLWMPGTDHAGIATQNVVEKKLMEEKSSRHELGREKFIEKVWEWRHTYGNAIIGQLKRLGASCDWDRERFTMDEGLSKAVRTVFVKLYNDGLIYQGSYITNWCPRCHTALADLEVEHEELDGHLFHIKYPFTNSKESVVVATTRPETMLGDTAVAVHPEDERYHELPAETVTLPVMLREIPIIKDKYVDMSFGTGALKVTPAHDPNDYHLGESHNLEKIKVIDDDGKMTAEAGKFEGMDRFDCREKLVQQLKAEGLLVKIEDLKHNVGHCYRCKTVVEPNLSKQWFVKTKPLAQKAIEAVKSGRTKIIPEVWTKTYFDWMLNIRDWCISRQIWWGHQIPAWTCTDCGELMVAMETPAGCPKCQSTDLVQESDVLDTWFSSALWPFSTMGWPEKTKILKLFYPTNVLVTGFDILFFWVARMMMMGLYFMDDVPFSDVYVHALVRDEDGQKMSKSKGNVIDPLDIIDEYGTDAFRFTLTAFAAQGRDIKMSKNRVEGYRHFINKLWNASRFALLHLENSKVHIDNSKGLTLPDQWIASRLNTLVHETADAIDSYRFNDAASLLYNFVWHEFCDWYLEAIKPVLYDKQDPELKENTRTVLWLTLKNSLILLHPLIPFVTEEIWHKIPGVTGSIMNSLYPKDTAEMDQLKKDPEAEKKMATIMEVITGIRNIRGEMNINPSTQLDVVLHSSNDWLRQVTEENKWLIINFAKTKSFTIDTPKEKPKGSATSVITDASIYVSLEGVIDFEKEIQRLTKEIQKIEKELVGISKKLNNDNYLSKAPQEVVAKTREKYNILSDRSDALQANLDRIKALGQA